MSAKLSFQPFNEQGNVRVYYNGFLPHWRQAGCSYFVTFRLADSVPKKVIDQWKYERDAWLKARGIDPFRTGMEHKFAKLSRSEQLTFERYFTGKLFQFLDQGYGACYLRDPVACKIAFDALLHFHGQRIEAGDLVVMPNHVHVLMTPLPGHELEEVLHSIKSFTANQINRHFKRTGVLWMEESHDHIVRDAEELIRIQRYIANNPIKARLKQNEYLQSDANYDLSQQ
ncbi:MAG: transposase [Pirellulaceae bacterium]